MSRELAVLSGLREPALVSFATVARAEPTAATMATKSTASIGLPEVEGT